MSAKRFGGAVVGWPILAVVVALGLVSACTTPPTTPPDPNTIRVSGSSAAEEQVPTSSDDGNLVAFQSPAADLVIGDTNVATDIFVRNVRTNSIELISVAENGDQMQGDSVSPCMSDDGRYVAFFNQSDRNVYVRDRSTRTTEQVNVDSDGIRLGGSAPVTPNCLSADGRFAVFAVAGTGYRRDRLNGITAAVNPTTTIDISDDGNVVSMATTASLLPGDRNNWYDAYAKNMTTGSLTLASSYPNGLGAVGVAVHNGLSGNGRFLLIESPDAFVPADQNGGDDLYVRDLESGQMELVSIGSNGLAAGINYSRTSNISDDGKRIAFTTPAVLAASDTNGMDDAYLRDRTRGTTTLISVGLNGAPADSLTKYAGISGNGLFAMFVSLASNIVQGDGNGGWDVFRRYLP